MKNEVQVLLPLPSTYNAGCWHGQQMGPLNPIRLPLWPGSPSCIPWGEHGMKFHFAITGHGEAANEIE